MERFAHLVMHYRRIVDATSTSERLTEPCGPTVNDVRRRCVLETGRNGTALATS